MLNDILTLYQLQWPPNRSDFPPISWPRYWSWPSPNYEWFQWSICNGFGMQAGNAYPSGHLFPFPLLGTCVCSNSWYLFWRACVFSRLFTVNTPMYFLDFAFYWAPGPTSCLEIFLTSTFYSIFMPQWQCIISIFFIAETVSCLSVRFQGMWIIVHLNQCH